MNRHINWILIADSSRATLLETDGKLQRWRLLRELDHPGSRRKSSELSAGGRGRTSPRNRDAARRAAMAPTTSPQQVEIEKFSRELAEAMRAGFDDNEYGTAMVVAPPGFLGLLRAALPPTVQAAICVEVGKNLTKERPEHVVGVLRKEAVSRRITH